MYVPAVTLSTEADHKLLEQFQTEFKRTTKWNQYRSEITKQTKANNLKYLINPTFNIVNRLFCHLKMNRPSFSKHYTPRVEIKDFNVLTERRHFFDVPIKNKEGT